MSSLLLSSESFAVNRSTYVPASLNAALVTVIVGLANVTVPGPLTLLQVLLSVLPEGRPSSLTVPLRLAWAGRVIVWSGPALEVGAWFWNYDDLNIVAAAEFRVVCRQPQHVGPGFTERRCGHRHSWISERHGARPTHLAPDSAQRAARRQTVIADRAVEVRLVGQLDRLVWSGI